MSYYHVKFGGHGRSGCGGISLFICHVALHNHLIKGSDYFSYLIQTTFRIIFMRFWSRLLKKSLMENLIFRALDIIQIYHGSDCARHYKIYCTKFWVSSKTQWEMYIIIRKSRVKCFQYRSFF